MDSWGSQLANRNNEDEREMGEREREGHLFIASQGKRNDHLRREGVDGLSNHLNDHLGMLS